MGISVDAIVRRKCSNSYEQEANVDRKSHWAKFRHGECHSSLGSKFNCVPKFTCPSPGCPHVFALRSCPHIHRCWSSHLHAIFWSMMDQDSRAILLRFYGLSDAFAQ